MSALEITSIIASAVGAVLSIVAIGISLYFYTQAKGSEGRVENALTGIKAQTDALKALHGRQLDRLTKYVTTPRDEHPHTAQLLADTMRDIPNIVLRLMPAPNGSGSQPTAPSPSRSELVHLYLALWSYIGSTNVWSSFSLPHPQAFNDEDNFDRLVKRVVDRSAGDFQFMSSIVDHLSRDEVESCDGYYIDLYNETQTTLRPMIGDTAFHFSNATKEEA
jgi:hypothetical protein